MGLKVLSLFDGMSCGQLALQRLGIEVDTYYASEIDKYAIQVTQANFPETIQIGDVTAWQTWDFDWSSIDLVTGGFPCQAWSLAGKQLGDKDERGKLFWTMLDVMSKVIEHNPKAFYLMENVKMKKEFEQYITYHTEQALPNVHKYLINSALVSAQNRQRYYWTNISGVEQPEDKGIVLRDILEDNFDSERDKSYCIDANYYKGASVEQYKRKSRRQLVNKPKQVGIATDIKEHDILKRVYSPDGKSPTLNTMGGGNREPKVAIKNLPKGSTGKSWFFEQQTYLPDSEKTRALKSGSGSGNIPKVVSGAWRGRYKEDGTTEQKLELNQSGKSNSLTTVQKDSVVVNEELSWRKLTCRECERLQTVPDNYTNHVSNTQRYKMLGNGWTVEVIAHILNNMKL